MDDFSTKGFLSSTLASQQARARERFKADFDACEAWSDRALASLNAMTAGFKHPSVLFAVACWMRCIRACQAGILLAERGMMPDALTQARSAVESLFYAVALVENPELLERFVEHDMFERIKQARGVLSVPSIMLHVTPEDRARIEALTLKAAEKPRDWPAYEAARHANLLELYQTLFRGFSLGAAHCTLTALDHELNPSSLGDLDFGPSYMQLTETLDMLGVCLRTGVERFAGKL
ncbi:DUF5677 domain-containing protein [Burkholderia sp. Tr-20390]|uniref:DUF5677 domain-containing protein n=1 Tax=Burkholderia sp. Tr-20390 TaxID=2703904 RepID=UPI00197F5E7D|nr:DUF5677 domain-containing protein [Burkholderia sp. Tr-20390]MBN3729395.1 hypothetical protein [Burkholderia sp. Tr-20390]